MLIDIRSSETLRRGYSAAEERITSHFALPVVTTLKGHEVVQCVALCEHSHVLLSCLEKNCDL